MHFEILFSICKKTQCQIRKCQDRALRCTKKLEVRQLADEHFSDEHNKEHGVFLLTLFIYLFNYQK